MAHLQNLRSLTTRPQKVLMVGSIPLANTRDVFSTLSSALPGRLATFPDGETAERFNFIGFQGACFPGEVLRTTTDAVRQEAEYTPGSVKPTDYDEAAISSYSAFVDLRHKGVIPKEARFQVGLPTPLNAIAGWCKEEYQTIMEPFYERRMGQAIQCIAENIPHDDVVIQLDLCFEIVMLEYERGRITIPHAKPYFAPVRGGILDRISRFTRHIPSDIDLAVHLCYGDYQHKHFVEPLDTDLLTEFANDVIDILKTTHRVRWVHMPVPRDRTDEAYFKPLRKLKLSDETLLYLGLIHANDETGTEKRLAMASSVYGKPFGVATECGLGRTPVEELDSILSIAKRVSSPVKS